ncbi:hypothetical protein Tco_0064637 [Tanacetum coccineum]
MSVNADDLDGLTTYKWRRRMFTVVTAVAEAARSKVVSLSYDQSRERRAPTSTSELIKLIVAALQASSSRFLFLLDLILSLLHQQLRYPCSVSSLSSSTSIASLLDSSFCSPFTLSFTSSSSSSLAYSLNSRFSFTTSSNSHSHLQASPQFTPVFSQSRFSLLYPEKQPPFATVSAASVTTASSSPMTIHSNVNTLPANTLYIKVN